MSTICKLDPRIREGRRMRRELLAHMWTQLRFIRSFPVSVRGEIEAFCTEAVDLLTVLLDDPTRTGKAKNRICARVTKEFRELVAEAAKSNPGAAALKAAL